MDELKKKFEDQKSPSRKQPSSMSSTKQRISVLESDSAPHSAMNWYFFAPTTLLPFHPHASQSRLGASTFHTPLLRHHGFRHSRAAIVSTTRTTIVSSMDLTADPTSWNVAKETQVLEDFPSCPPAETFFPLQNGSDIRGVALAHAGYPNEDVTLTRNHVRMILAAFTRYVRKCCSDKKMPKIAVGRDSRLSGSSLLGVALEGIIGESGLAVNTVLGTTPAMFMTTALWDCDAAVMITASHLPKNRNGLKFFVKDKGGLSSSEVKEILVDAGNGWVGTNVQGKREERSFLTTYADFLKQKIVDGSEKGERPLEGFKIVVDAGNGAGGFFATDVLESLGADITGSQFLEEDGNFPNHVANPEDKKAMQMTIDATLNAKADLGIIFDTDVDRAAVVDQSGKPINRNRLIALLSRIVLRTDPGATIVTDSVTSNGLKRFIEKHGGKHFRYRKGYKNVIDKGIELDAPLAIETSGHGAMKENYMLDDGAYLVVKILIEMVRMRADGKGGTISDLIADLDEPVESNEFRLGFKDQSGYKEYGDKVLQSFKSFASNVDGWTVEDENYEGYRVKVDEENGKEGWILLRQSLHDPILPLNIESEISGGTKAIVRNLCDNFFTSQENMNMKPLKQFLSAQ
eukprot:Plantae.Rhodophyta-Hildenbrandia_rubra.ctg8203.p1 GENE.Plantae.Rhodophyta-Hildenbrandia_rubra.ctg8203~~Plantae.Rhodophyta-Hildenbrandia_rubra.ctg8203.p1  ORF type:complete len:631 (+),score=118.04 Plantae.Rhodophyta-Hildenbrandia_rubra.ctg8203:1851-3743(+)